MTQLSAKSNEALLNLVVLSKELCPEIIADVSVAFHLPDSAPSCSVLTRCKRLKQHFSKLSIAMMHLDAVVDELEGRKPVVPVDEQRAA